MKFTWFNLMPWPYLPDDFREKHRSVWVDIPNTLYDPRKGHEVYHTYLDQLEYAESLGFDGIGCNEHHQNGYGLMPSTASTSSTGACTSSRPSPRLSATWEADWACRDATTRGPRLGFRLSTLSTLQVGDRGEW